MPIMAEDCWQWGYKNARKAAEGLPHRSGVANSTSECFLNGAASDVLRSCQYPLLLCIKIYFFIHWLYLPNQPKAARSCRGYWKDRRLLTQLLASFLMQQCTTSCNIMQAAKSQIGDCQFFQSTSAPLSSLDNFQWSSAALMSTGNERSISSRM